MVNINNNYKQFLQNILFIFYYNDYFINNNYSDFNNYFILFKHNQRNF